MLQIKRKKEHAMTNRDPAATSHLEGNYDPFGWLEKCRSCVSNWLAARSRRARARRLADQLARLDPHMRDDIGLPRDFEIPRGARSTIAVETLIRIMTERER
jgi:hypothetical protein